MLFWLTVVVIPIVTCVVIALLSNLVKIRRLNVIYTILTGICIGLMLTPVLYYYMQHLTILEGIAITLPYIGRVSLWLNPISAIYALFSTIILLCVAVYSLPYMEHRSEELKVRKDLATYFILYILYAVGLLGIVYSSNLILMFVFLELSVVTSFLLILLYGYGERLRIALLYFIWSQIASLTLLCGLILIMLDLGTVNVIEYLKLGRTLTSWIPFVLVLVGCFIKMGTMLVHFWLPWAHAEAPSPISAILSPVQIGLMSYVLIEILHPLFPTLLVNVSYIIALYGILTTIYGAIMALSELDFKRFLAYSSISHMGSLVLCISYPSQLCELAAAIVFTAHALAKAILFMYSGYILYRTGIRDMSKLGGLYDLMPSSSIIGLIGFISLAGVFNVGLISKIYLTAALICIMRHCVTETYCAVIYYLLYIVGLVLSVAYAFLAARRIYFGKPHDIKLLPYTVLTMEIPMAVLAMLTVLLLVPEVLHLVIGEASTWSFVTPR